VSKVGVPIDVVLEPWGRVEGKVMVGEKVGANERVSITSFSNDEAQEKMVNQSLETRSDNQGRFAFEQVLPRMTLLSYSINSSSGQHTSMSPIPAVKVNPGQTTRLELGRTGRPVIGRLAIPETIKAQSENHLWGSIAYSPRPPKPLEVLTVEERRRWTQEERMTSRSYGLAIQPDGSFKAEDVPPGRHLVQAVLYLARSSRPGPRKPFARNRPP